MNFRKELSWLMLAVPDQGHSGKEPNFPNMTRQKIRSQWRTNKLIKLGFQAVQIGTPWAETIPKCPRLQTYGKQERYHWTLIIFKKLSGRNWSVYVRNYRSEPPPLIPHCAELITTRISVQTAVSLTESVKPWYHVTSEMLWLLF